MIKVSKLADYSALIMHALAAVPGAVLSVSVIAERTAVPQPTVSKLLKKMVKSGLVTSVRGPEGGYGLSRQPAEISIAEVITAIEGQPALTECSVSNSCSHDSDCGLKHNWQLINQVVMSALESISLADMGKPLEYHPLVKNGIEMKPVIRLHTESSIDACEGKNHE